MAEFVIRNRHDQLMRSILTGEPMRLSRNLAEETRADLDFEQPASKPHRVEPTGGEQA